MKKLINICGTSRSGSTMLDLILGNDPRGFSLGEIYAWFRPFRTHHFQLSCSCNGSDCPWDSLKFLDEREFYKNAFEILNVDFLVDSSKNLSWVIDNNIHARNLGIQVYNLLIYKEPLSFLYSFWKRGHSINKAIRKSYIRYYKRCFQSGLSFISLNYNAFVADPQTELKKICNLVDIPYFDGKEKFWKKTHHHLFGSQGTRNQVENRKSIIDNKYNYPTEYQNLIPKIEHDNQRNKELQNLLSELRKSNILHQSVHQFNKTIKKPYWYYLQKLKQRIRRIFPEDQKKMCKTKACRIIA